jgi:hypothetical protein
MVLPDDISFKLRRVVTCIEKRAAIDQSESPVSTS